MIIDGKKVSEKIQKDIKKKIKDNNYTPSLVVLEVGNNSSNNVYIKAKQQACKNVNIKFNHIKYKEDIKEEVIIKDIEKLNKDNKVNAILLQLPISKHLDEDKILNTIDIKKDVDGLTNYNTGLLVNKKALFIPCTPLGIIKLLEFYNISVENKNIVILSRSKLVGKPLLNILINMDANVTICHSKTKNLKNYTKNADILIVGIGKKHYIDSSYVKKDSVVIDVGITKDGNKVYGDVNPNVYDKVSSYTPVPGGVGIMTVTMLLNNVLEAYIYSLKE